jgi:hypothetical protein
MFSFCRDRERRKEKKNEKSWGGKKGRKEINRLEWGMQIMEISTMGSHQLVNRKEKKISDGIQGLM